ncbi:lipoteichoic acid synthase LtaS Type IVb [Bacteroides pyogenes JCM 6292]|uniref:Lipoteichoic acid synthase LtaS Type IVb n=1 Tax=Bacteroides pyogenes JCM 6292 TaxID=1235809 RepID=W4P4W0_9BACE|nr:lipoteichoic acid synthase LtaS Type IVb [Bacteroides pyogenes JCM 6292]
MYFRTYFTSIPWDSYFLAGNLADFSDSVLSSLRWSDLLFPLSTVLFFVLIRGQKLGDRLKENLSRSLKFLAVCIGAPAFVLGVIFAFYGGYKKLTRLCLLTIRHAVLQSIPYPVLCITSIYRIKQSIPLK